MTMKFRGMSGYDPATKKFVRVDFDSSGGMVHLSSPGWEGDKMTWVGDGTMMGQKVKMRHTMTKKSDTEFTSLFESAGPDGKFAAMGEDDCKKSAGAKK
jgi:hypothetical protein